MKNEIVIFSEDNGSMIGFTEVIDTDGTVKGMYATAEAMADYLGVSTKQVWKHIKTIEKDEEFQRDSKVAFGATLGIKKKKQGGRSPKYYNHEYLFELLYLVRDSSVARRFRRWATDHLARIIDQGYSSEPRIQRREADKGMSSLIMRSAEISSEGDISIREAHQIFHNAIHVGVHGHTARGLIVARFDPEHPLNGILHWTTGRPYPTQKDGETALNFNTSKELRTMTGVIHGFVETATLAYDTTGVWTLDELSSRLVSYCKQFNLRDQPIHPPVPKGYAKRLIKSGNWKKCKSYMLNGKRKQLPLFDTNN